MGSDNSRETSSWMSALGLAVAALVCLAGFAAVVMKNLSSPSMERQYRLDFDGHIAYMSGQTMGGITFLAVINTDGYSHDQILAACDGAWAEIDKVNQTMNPYNHSSSLSKLNSAGVGESVEMDARLFELIIRSRKLSGATSGAFDPTCRALFEFYKYMPDDADFPSDQQLLAVQKYCGWDKFEFLLDGAPAIQKNIDAAQIDLGAIAKGYAADMALDSLRKSNIAGALIEVGGEVALFGQPSKTKNYWVIGLNDPFEPDNPDGTPNICGKMALSAPAAVATSGDYRRYVQLGGKRYSHIIDPRSAKPASATHSVTVVASNCALADALATALSVSGPNEAERIISKVKSDITGEDALIEAMIISGTPENSQIFKTSGFDALLVGELDFSLPIVED